MYTSDEEGYVYMEVGDLPARHQNHMALFSMVSSDSSRKFSKKNSPNENVGAFRSGEASSAIVEAILKTIPSVP